jgi:signal transduction histidine kinase
MELPANDGRGGGRPASTTTTWQRLFTPVFAVYALGLMVWLVLGLLPTLADSLAPVRHWAHTLATSSSPLAGMAGRILDARQTLPGFALEASNRGSVALAYLFSVLNLVLALILASRRPRLLVPCLLAFALAGTAATFNKPSHAVFHIIGEPWPVKAVHFTFHVVSGVAYLWAVLLFPDGRLPRQVRLEGRPLVAVVAAVTIAVAVVSWRGSFIDHPVFFVVFFGVDIPIIGLAAVTLRLADPQATVWDRRSARLLGAALLPAFAVGLAWLAARAAGALGVSQAHHLQLTLQSIFPAAFAVVPVVLFAGILRYRLWNINWLLSQGLLYGSLAVAVTLAYVAVVSVAGLVAGTSLWTVVIILSLVAVAIDPLREVLRSWSNRIVYGQVMTPTDAVRSMLSSLDRLAPDAELAQLTRTATQATRARRAELWLASSDHLLRVAAYPEAPGGTVRMTRPDPDDDADADPDDDPAGGHLHVPIRFQDQALGRLSVELPAGRDLGPVEVALIQDLAGHAGVVAHNAVLNSELARHVAVLADQLDELRAARRRLVAAQDAERRKLERDLHDGAQQSLVAALIGLRTIPVVDASADAGLQEADVREVTQLLQDTSSTLGELVSDQGPRALAQRGLVGALTAAAAVAGRSGTRVEVTGAVGPDVPQDVAVAIYFCCLEAVQNATKHAEASHIGLAVWQSDGLITFEISDDGRGFDPSRSPKGSGLSNLVGRLSVIGGDVSVESAPGAGTTVRGSVPVVEHLEPV